MIIGTAGHIDHGKSALVEALTGTRMDPLPEERRRGVTVDLHFAALTLPGIGTAGVVDVPGHEDLVRTMVAGATGIDLVLLVIAADEGIMPQTREHLAVVEQLRIRRGVPVITKADLVETAWLSLVTEEVTAWLGNSSVAFAAPIATSVPSGQGIGALRAEIGRALSEVPTVRAPDDLARLPIDRAFSLAGVGTVVTGTAWSGVFRIGDAVRVLPTGLNGRIRSLEHHGEPVGESAPGERLAVGLAGIAREELGRGQVLLRADDPWEVTSVLDARIALLSSAPRPLTHHTRIRLHLGTLEVMARLNLKEPIAPGSNGYARLVLEEPTVARGGDRLVLRSYSPVAVIGGGEVIDPLPPPGRPDWSPGLDSPNASERFAALLARRHNGVIERQLPVLLGVSPTRVAEVLSGAEVVGAGPVVVSTGQVLSAQEVALGAVHAYQERHPAESGMPTQTLRQLVRRCGPAGVVGIARLLETGRLVAGERGVVHEGGFRPESAGGDAMTDRLVALITAAGMAPPTVSEIESVVKENGVAETLRLAARAGRLIQVDRDRYFGLEALAGFTAALIRVATAGPITPAAVRDETGITRKLLIPLLEWADRSALTIRRGDARVPGPALSKQGQAQRREG